MSKPKDIFFKFKYMGYCMANLPPENVNTEFADFLNYVKFQLCQSRKVLMKDPIWDTYADEEILVEYFAMVYNTSTEEADKFISQVNGEDPDLHNWFEKMEKENKKEIDNLLDNNSDNISFNPNDVLGE